MKLNRVLIVHAHPEANSFCSALKDNAKKHFENAGAEVIISDLYAMKFNPVGDKHDFIELKNPDYFKYQLEQVNAYENQLFTPELKAEMDKFLWADLIIFNFPLWWFGLPAILKGWVDRVFAMGLVYGAGKGVYENGFYKDKTALLTFTTGGPETAYNGGKNGDLDNILFPIHHGMLYFAGMNVLPPFIVFSPVRKQPNELDQALENHNNYLSKLSELSPLYGNSSTNE